MGRPPVRMAWSAAACKVEDDEVCITSSKGTPFTAFTRSPTCTTNPPPSPSVGLIDGATLINGKSARFLASARPIPSRSLSKVTSNWIGPGAIASAVLALGALSSALLWLEGTAAAAAPACATEDEGPSIKGNAFGACGGGGGGITLKENEDSARLPVASSNSFTSCAHCLRAANSCGDTC